MAEDSQVIKDEGVVENPKLEEKNAVVPAADGVRPTSPAASFPSLSVNIWPPSQRTRDAILNRLIENLSTPSVLSKRYGTLSSEEASAIARIIEEEAYAVASAAASASASAHSEASRDEVASVEASVDEGMEILHIYSKEISRRMIDSVKAKGPSASSAPVEGNAVPAAGNDGEDAGSSVSDGENIAPGESQPSVA